MNKTLCVMVVLLGCALALSLGNASTPNATSTSPVIVAKRRLVNQTAPIPTTTIYTPAHDSVYRLSPYATITTADPNSSSYWSFNIGWADDAGPQRYNGLLFAVEDDRITGPFQWSQIAQYGATVTFEAKAGTPITYSVTLEGAPDNSAYSLYYVLEQIE
jgi:hypothetical protein